MGNYSRIGGFTTPLNMIPCKDDLTGESELPTMSLSESYYTLFLHKSPMELLCSRLENYFKEVGHSGARALETILALAKILLSRLVTDNDKKPVQSQPMEATLSLARWLYKYDSHLPGPGKSNPASKKETPEHGRIEPNKANSMPKRNGIQVKCYKHAKTRAKS